jgi:hypothetical protein
MRATRYQETVGNPERVLASTSLTMEEIAELVKRFTDTFRKRMADTISIGMLSVDSSTT